MAIAINGSGTITGISAGGLPDDTVDNGTMADDAIGVAKLSATGTASSSTYLRGDNSWATPTAGALTKVFSTTLDDTSGAIDIETAAMFDGTYDNLLIQIPYCYNMSADDISIYMNIKLSSYQESSNKFHWQQHSSTSNSVVVDRHDSTSIIKCAESLGNAANESWMMNLYFSNPNSSDWYTFFNWNLVGSKTDSALIWANGAGVCTQADTQVQGIRFRTSSGDFGNIKIVGYGYNK